MFYDLGNSDSFLRRLLEHSTNKGFSLWNLFIDRAIEIGRSSGNSMKYLFLIFSNKRQNSSEQEM